MKSYSDRQRELIAQLAGGGTGATTVPMQKDYVSQAFCLTVHAAIPSSLSDFLDREIIAQLRACDPEHYYYPPETLHLTVKNVRAAANPPRFTDRDAAAAAEALRSAVAGLRPISFRLHGAVRFPTSVCICALTTEYLCDVVTTLDQALRQAGLPDDKQYVSNEVFFGNVTICRFTRAPSPALLQRLETCRERPFGEFRAARLDLVVSDVVCSAGSRRLIESYPLGAA